MFGLMHCVLLAAATAAPVSLDPRVAFDSLRSRYRDGIIAERIEVRATSDARTRGESLTFQLAPPGIVQVTFGDYSLWSDGVVLRIAHRLDERALFETPIGEAGVLGTIETVLPPFPIPQLALALANDPSAALTPYTRGVAWGSARMDPDAVPPIMEINGTSDRVEVSLNADGRSGRVLGMTTIIDGGRARIELTSEPLSPAETPIMGIERGRRRVVTDLSELKPRPGFVLVGDQKPPLGLRVWRSGTEWQEDPRGPGAVILMRRWQPGLTPRAAYEAGKRVAARVTGFGVFPVIVLTPGQPEARAYVDGASFEAPGLEMRHSYSPEESIERFSEHADQIMVVLDEADAVRAIMEINPGKGGAAPEGSEVDALEDAISRALAR